MNYLVIVIPASIALLLVSLTIPWATINFQGQWSYDPIGIMKDLTDRKNVVRNADVFGSKPNFFGFTSVNMEITFDMALGVITYLVSAAVMIVSLVSLLKKSWSKIALLGGFLAIIGGMTWINAIQSFKTAAIANGLPEGLVNGTVVTGFGPYLAVIAGIIPAAGYIIERISRVQDQQKTADFNM